MSRCLYGHAGRYDPLKPTQTSRLGSGACAKPGKSSPISLVPGCVSFIGQHRGTRADRRTGFGYDSYCSLNAGHGRFGDAFQLEFCRSTAVPQKDRSGQRAMSGHRRPPGTNPEWVNHSRLVTDF